MHYGVEPKIARYLSKGNRIQFTDWNKVYQLGAPVTHMD